MKSPVGQDGPRVTVVVATHNRPDALTEALRSLIAQTVTDWRAIIVGDACDPATANAVATLDDPRIVYVNLMQRCGEQALPNSVGMLLARTPFVAFLNHDDLWLPDHLAVGIRRMSVRRAGVFLGRAAFACTAPRQRDHAVLHSQTPPDRRLRDAFDHNYRMMEPVSSWILRRRVIRRIGPMTAAALIYRTPVEDYALRLWRGGVRACTSTKVTVVKDNSSAPGPADSGSYQRARMGLLPFGDAIRSEGADGFRAHLPDRMAAALAAGARERDYRALLVPDETLFQSHLTPEAAAVFRATGVDGYELACRAAGLAPGWRIRETLWHRVRQDLGQPPDLLDLVRTARSQLRGQGPS